MEARYGEWRAMEPIEMPSRVGDQGQCSPFVREKGESELNKSKVGMQDEITLGAQTSVDVADMSEAATIIGLVASIASLVDLSAKVVSRLHDFTSETSDIPDSCHALLVRLPLLTATLQRVQTQAEADGLSKDVTKALKAFVDNTSDQLSVVQTCLCEILRPDGASDLEQALKALKSLAKEDKV